jgi:hypothetical protein
LNFDDELMKIPTYRNRQHKPSLGLNIHLDALFTIPYTFSYKTGGVFMGKFYILILVVIVMGPSQWVLAENPRSVFELKMNKPPETGNKPFVELRKETPVPSGSSKVEFKNLPPSGGSPIQAPTPPTPPKVQQQPAKTDYSSMIKPKQPSGGNIQPPAPPTARQKAKSTASEPPSPNPYTDAARNFMQNYQHSGKK